MGLGESNRLSGNSHGTNPDHQHGECLGNRTLPGYDAAIPALVDRVWNAGLAVGQSALRPLGADYQRCPSQIQPLPRTTARDFSR